MYLYVVMNDLVLLIECYGNFIESLFVMNLHVDF